jgi:PD-(D/E)XK nuclease superfamily
VAVVQIDKIPPLRQSTQEVMSCPKFYATEVIEGNRLPPGLDSARGTQIHKTMAAYTSFCALHRVSVDLDAFDRFSRGAGPQAAKILSGLRDGFEVDFGHLFATELTLTLDENFEPTHLALEMQGIVSDSNQQPHYQGTLDGLYLFPERAALRIDDFKSHAKPFDPDDKPQGKEYAVFAFKHFPWVNEVTFRLVFVRYRKVTREVTYTRDQLSALIDGLRAARERQKSLHEAYAEGREIEAIAGNHCYYCPLLTNAACPIAQWNPATQFTMQQRLNFNLWYSAFSRANNKAMKAFIDEKGRGIALRDFNGKSYVYNYVPTEKELYPVFKFDERDNMVMISAGQPVLPIISLLLDYHHSNPEDTSWMKKIVISSTMGRYLKTKGRVNLDQAIEDAVVKVPGASLRVSKPLDAVPEEFDDEDEFEDEEEL